MFRIKNKQSLLKYALLSLIATLVLVITSLKFVKAQSTIADTVAVTIKNFKFVPNQLKIPTDQKVTLKFQNNGTVTHAFMAGTDVTDNLKGFNNGLFSGVHVVKTVNGKTTEKTYGSKSLMLGVKPGHTATLTFTMPESKSGNYKFGCFKSTGTGQTKHYSIGMKGTIQIGNQLSSK